MLGLACHRHRAAVGGPDKAVFDHGITATMLGGVQRRIGGFDQIACISLGLVLATPTLAVTV